MLGAAGMAFAAAALPRLPPDGRAQQQAPGKQQQQQQMQSEQHLEQQRPAQQPTSTAAEAAAQPAASTKDRDRAAVVSGRSQLVLLCLAHSVISLTFFLTQAWVPTFLHSTYALTDLNTVGLLSALPWLVRPSPLSQPPVSHSMCLTMLVSLR